MKKSFLPKAWYWQKYSKDNQAFVEFYTRFGQFMSSDHVAEMREHIYILPCLSFSFNHSEVFVQFAWLNFTCWLWCKDYKRSDAYMEKMIQKNREK